jgi:hypothetical protein
MVEMTQIMERNVLYNLNHIKILIHHHCPIIHIHVAQVCNRLSMHDVVVIHSKHGTLEGLVSYCTDASSNHIFSRLVNVSIDINKSGVFHQFASSSASWTG